MNGERCYTTKIWQRPSSIGFSSADALSTSMDPPAEPVISIWKRPCQRIQNGSEFPELAAQNFRNPQLFHQLGIRASITLNWKACGGLRLKSYRQPKTSSFAAIRFPSPIISSEIYMHWGLLEIQRLRDFGYSTLTRTELLSLALENYLGKLPLPDSRIINPILEKCSAL